ncbi:MAG: hypothetical protein JEZ11_08585 [Desulfobacterales bacterium]|nr:hypothetical protein [Desulfobacterales bacterium]
MKTIIVSLITLALVISGMPALAMDGHTMKHGSSHDSGGAMAGHFKHQAMSDHIHSEFQIMSLASMNMTDAGGATHHVMVKLMDGQTQSEIKSAVGKVKVIAPDGKEQEGTLKNYGGVLAANFTFSQKGKYGIICLFKAEGKQHVVKFWYPHQG